MDRFNAFTEKHFRAVFFCILACAAAAYSVLALKTYVWCDEAFTLALIRHPYSEIWRLTAADSHPPLYYFLLKAFTSPFHGSILSARLFSVIPYLFVPAFGGLQLARLFNKKTGLLFMLLFLFYPFSMTYAVEIRMYSLAAACVLGNAVFAYRTYLRPSLKNGIGLVLFGVAAAYTHNYALVSVGILYAALLAAILVKKRKLWPVWLAAAAASVVLYLPWIGAFAGQVLYKIDHAYWIEEITLKTVYNYVCVMFSAHGIRLYLPFLGCVYLGVFLYVLLSRRFRFRAVTLLSLLVPVATIAAGVGLSTLIRPIFVIRYVIPAVPLLIVFPAIPLGQWDDGVLTGCVLTVALLGGLSQFSHHTQLLEMQQNRIPVSECEAAQCYVIASDDVHVQNVLSYYVTDRPIYYAQGGEPEGVWPYVHPLSRFDASLVDSFVVLTDPGEAVPDAYLDGFDCEMLGTWIVEYRVDAYLLTRKP